MADVLVVDDNEDCAYAARRLLERRGHSVEVQHGLAGALRAVKALSYDVVVTDKNLGGRRGVTPLLDYLEEERPDTIVVLYSAEDMTQARRELNADVFVSKMTGPFEFLDAVEAALGTR